MNYVFTNIFCAALLFSSLGVIYSKNALHSILFLVSTFFFSSMTVFLLENEFLALFLLIIYVGAVMVLFLFVVMMMDLKHNILKVSRLHFLTGAAFMVVSVQFFWCQISAMFCFSDYSKNVFLLQTNKNWFSYLDQTQDIAAISSVFYHNYAAQILIAGLLLYVAVVGVVFLTTSRYKGSSVKSRQSLTRQLSRSSVL